MVVRLNIEDSFWALTSFIYRYTSLASRLVSISILRTFQIVCILAVSFLSDSLNKLFHNPLPLLYSSLAAQSLSPLVYSKHAQARLVLEKQSIRPGDTLRAGIYMKMERGWHVYWQNPADSGQAVRVRWELPSGIKLLGEAILWPLPKRLPTPPLMSYGYTDEVLFPSNLKASSSLQPGQSLHISAQVDWLECKVKCLPGKAYLQLEVPVELRAKETAGAGIAWRRRFAYAQSQLPPKLEDNLKANGIKQSEAFFQLKDNYIQLHVPLAFTKKIKPDTAYFFVGKQGIVAHAAPQTFRIYNNTIKDNASPPRPTILQITIERDMRYPKPEELDGVVVYTIGKDKLALQLNSVKPKVTPTLTGELSLIWIILFALLGGLLLNLMPCVLPVLALKIMHLLPEHSANGVKPSTYSSSFRVAVAYSLGIITCFWSLALIIWVLRGQGVAVGWGFQLQSPIFVFCMILLFVLITLNFWGVYELGSSMTRLASIGKVGELSSPAKERKNDSASFFNGFLACLVATPCTAPFMAVALGYALLQTNFFIVLLVFTCLGLGLASPFLVISLFPRLLRFLPKPGPWMLSLKQFLGFCILATALWLLWVLLQISTPSFMFQCLLSSLLLSLTAWLYGRWASVSSFSMGRRLFAYALVVSLLAFISYLLFFFAPERVGDNSLPQNSSFANAQKIPDASKSSSANLWQVYNPKQIEKLRGKKAIFINFTADWCLSCKLNERFVFADSKVQNFFRKNNIALFKADWTRYDPKITEALIRYGRSGIPLYVYYAPTKTNEASSAHLLPTLLTNDILFKELQLRP